MIRGWLKESIPEWINFQINACGKYLGVYLGPKIGGLNWQAPMEKMSIRAEEIASQRGPLVHACGQFEGCYKYIYIYIQSGHRI